MRLKLTHCFSVVGHGLEPLRGSTVLERIDLGLVRTFEVPIALDDALILTRLFSPSSLTFSAVKGTHSSV